MTPWKQLMETARDVAPALAGAAAALVSGGNPAAGGAAYALARKLTGAGTEEDLEVVASQILADPEMIQEFRLGMGRLEQCETRIRALDVQDARKTLAYSKGAIMISIIVLVSYFISALMVMTSEIPSGSQNLAYLLLGNLGTGFGMVLTFWLGSSVGSKQKGAVMDRYVEAARAGSGAK
jgi:hypothetical protein